MGNIVLDELMHYGTKRHSGRYPWGSGDNPYQHESAFLKEVHEKREQNFEYTEKNPESKDYGKTFTGDLAIAKSMGLNSSQFRTKLSLENNKARAAEVKWAKDLKEQGKSLNEIAAIMGYENDSSIRSLLNKESEARMLSAEKTADFLKEQVDRKGMLLVGKGSNKEIDSGINGGISPERMKSALYILEMQGYPIYKAGIPQVTNPGKQTNVKVLCKPGTQHKDVYQFDKLHTISEDWVSKDGGATFEPSFVYPESMSSKRLKVRYAEEGGSDKDGVIEIRRGVKDLDLGGSHYAQVRIMVDGTHYLKGMAVYADDKDLPEGVDVIFNTNKKEGTPVIGPKDNSVLKPIKSDPRNPFGSLIKEGVDDPDFGTKGGGQSYYIDDNGDKKLSLINKRSDEGDWMEWSDKLPSQFLAKQSMRLITRQLDLAKADKRAEYEEILSYNNPTVRKKLLSSFADDCDASAVHLKAAALPRQSYQVILPLTSIKDDEIYAPNYKNGEKVALIRYPHGGTFEIPILTVNNKISEGKSVIGEPPKDAVGRKKNVADRLSGADFDGDTVMVIPCNNPGSSVNIISTPPLKGLEGFDPKFEYGGRPEGSFKKMKNTQNEMGVISNLITDMTLKGANQEELARAVRHSMVVIDAEKHNLDYKASEEDNGIKELKRRYQGRIDEDGKYHEGAATLISRSKNEKDVVKTKGSPRIDPKTGELVYKSLLTEEEAKKAVNMKNQGKTDEEIAIVLGKKPSDIKELVYVEKDRVGKNGNIIKGKAKYRTKESTQMAEAKDAYILSTGTPQENAYANYANYMKSLANEARKTMLNTKDIVYSPSAKETYKKEVSSLEAQLNLAILNKPKEQLAQAKANAIVAEKKKMDPDLSQKELKKIRQQALVDARISTGAARRPISVSPKEWEAIQAGAISANKLSEILLYMDDDQLKQYVMPNSGREISPTKQTKIAAMAAQGYTPSEISDATGVSVSTVNRYIDK